MLNEIWMIEAKKGKKKWMVFGSSMLPAVDEEEACRICAMWKYGDAFAIEYRPVKYILDIS